MPDLQVVSLQDNLISEIHELTFRRIWHQLAYVLLEGKCHYAQFKQVLNSDSFYREGFRQFRGGTTWSSGEGAGGFAFLDPIFAENLKPSGGHISMLRGKSLP